MEQERLNGLAILSIEKAYHASPLLCLKGIFRLARVPSTQNSQRTEEHIQWQTPVTVMLIGQAEEVLCPQGHTALNATQKGRGREMDFSAWVYLSLPSSSQLLFFHPTVHLFTLAILAHCTDCTIYITLHYPHTHKHKYSILALSTQAHEHYLSALFALLSSLTSTLTQPMHTVISVYTPLPVNMFSLCVLFFLLWFYCDLCMYVCELLDDLNFPRD